MKKITHENETYILQSDVENIIGDRVKKYAARAAAADENIKELQTRIDEQSKNSSDVNLLRDKIDTLQNQLSKSETKFTRHVAISKHGISSPEVVELIEWSYEKQMDKRAKKDREGLSDWLDGMITNPDNAPLTLRPHLPANQTPAPEVEPSTENDVKPSSTIDPAPINRGAVNTPENSNFARMNDSEYYRANREQIKKQFYQQLKRRG
jgi:hypothetical protein